MVAAHGPYGVTNACYCTLCTDAAQNLRTAEIGSTTGHDLDRDMAAVDDYLVHDLSALDV